MNNFYSQLAKIVNSGQSRSIVLCGNVYDLFFDGEKYVPLAQFLSAKSIVNKNESNCGITQIIYEVNKSIRIVGDVAELKKCWNDHNVENFDHLIKESFANSLIALEFIRNLSSISKGITNNLLVIIEGADILMPQSDFARMSMPDRRRCAVVHDWFTDPDFLYGHNTVVLIAESRSQIQSYVSSLPQLMTIDVPYPCLEYRTHFIKHKSPEISDNLLQKLSQQTAGLSIHALHQIICDDKFPDLSKNLIISKVEEYIITQLGEDVVEFKRPEHSLEDVVGFSCVKEFISNELIPRFKATDKSSLSGAGVAGPIGAGKTFLMEAVAAELDMPVLVLKNLRSQFYGQTDVIFERLKRTLVALGKVMIFVDEADTQFGDVNQGSHETERRLTGKIQAMMSDNKLRGKVIWLLMTARIEKLSADIRRPGRVGDLIIPILDPIGEDKTDFLHWLLKSVGIKNIITEELEELEQLTQDYSAASFESLRSLILAKKCKSFQDIIEVVSDVIPSDISRERRYQTLQALINCTRKSLLPLEFRADWKAAKDQWLEEIKNYHNK